MTKAEARRYWQSVTFRRRRRYWTLENGQLVPGLSFAQFWRVVQQQARLERNSRDTGGNLVL